MTNNKPLLSIAIPTRNRQIYCIDVIKHILSYEYKDFELCVHDHSDDRTIEKFVSTVEDDRLKYIYTTQNLSSVENMSRSIEMTQGEFVYMIGDDDTVLPNIFKWAEYMKSNNIESICPAYRPEYFWPNKETGNTGTLKIVRYKNMPSIEEVKPMERLGDLFKNGIIQFPKYHLPRVYHGIVSKELLDEIFYKVGSYFAGLSPDIYSTVALSSLVKKHYVINEACSIAGACPESTTSKGRLNSDDGKFERTPHLKNNEDYQWDYLIPKYYCGEVIWAESAITAARDFQLEPTLSKFNRKLFNNASLSYNRHISNIVIEAYFDNIKKENNSINRNMYILNSYTYQIKDFVKRGFSKLFLKTTSKNLNVKDIERAEKICRGVIKL